MKRDPRIKKLSWDHHHGLVMALRITRELPNASDEGLAELYSDLIAFWSAGLLPHFRVEQECLLARLVRHLPSGDEAVSRTQEDHLAIEALVATMRDATGHGDRRIALAAFAETLREHIRWEEETLFEVTQRRLTSAELDALSAEIEEFLPEVTPAPAGAAFRAGPRVN
jgi:hemerythrin-like domain-containing protein